MVNSFRKQSQSHRQRYRHWCTLPGCAIFFIPSVFGPSQHINRFEELLIRCLQPPTQIPDRERDKCREQKHRQYPHLRPKPTLEAECQLNVLHRLQFEPDMQERFFRCGLDFREACEHSFSPGTPTSVIMADIYLPQYALLLALYLGGKCRRLDYKRVWQWKNPIESLLLVWEKARSLDHLRKVRVQRKVDRFFRTSSLFPAKQFRICVSSSSKKVLGAVRTIKRGLIRIIASRSSVLFGRYLASKLVIFPANKT